MEILLTIIFSILLFLLYQRINKLESKINFLNEIIKKEPSKKEVSSDDYFRPAIRKPQENSNIPETPQYQTEPEKKPTIPQSSKEDETGFWDSLNKVTFLQPLIKLIKEIEPVTLIGGIIFLAGIFSLISVANSYFSHSIMFYWVKIGLASIIGASLIKVGSEFIRKNGAYGALLIGVGVAVLYITTIVTHLTLNLISASLALVILIGISSLSSYLSIKNNFELLMIYSGIGFYLPFALDQSMLNNISLILVFCIMVSVAVCVIHLYKNWITTVQTSVAASSILIAYASTLNSEINTHSHTFSVLALFSFNAIIISSHIFNKDKANYNYLVPFIFAPLSIFFFITREADALIYNVNIAQLIYGVFLLSIPTLFKKKTSSDIVSSTYLIGGLGLILLAVINSLTNDIKPLLFILEGGIILYAGKKSVSGIKSVVGTIFYQSGCLYLMNTMLKGDSIIIDITMIVITSVIGFYFLITLRDYQESYLKAIKTLLFFTTPFWFFVYTIISAGDENFTPIFAALIAFYVFTTNIKLASKIENLRLMQTLTIIGFLITNLLLLSLPDGYTSLLITLLIPMMYLHSGFFKKNILTNTQILLLNFSASYIISSLIDNIAGTQITVSSFCISFLIVNYLFIASNNQNYKSVFNDKKILEYKSLFVTSTLITLVISLIPFGNRTVEVLYSILPILALSHSMRILIISNDKHRNILITFALLSSTFALSILLNLLSGGNEYRLNFIESKNYTPVLITLFWVAIALVLKIKEQWDLNRYGSILLTIALAKLFIFDMAGTYDRIIGLTVVGAAMLSYHHLKKRSKSN